MRRPLIALVFILSLSVGCAGAQSAIRNPQSTISARCGGAQSAIANRQSEIPRAILPVLILLTLDRETMLPGDVVNVSVQIYNFARSSIRYHYMTTVTVAGGDGSVADEATIVVKPGRVAERMFAVQIDDEGAYLFTASVVSNNRDLQFANVSSSGLIVTEGIEVRGQGNCGLRISDCESSFDGRRSATKAVEWVGRLRLTSKGRSSSMFS